MSARIVISYRIVITIAIPIERLRITRIGYQRVSGDELADTRVVVAGVVIQQPEGFFALAGVIIIGLRGAERPADLTVGIMAFLEGCAVVQVGGQAGRKMSQ
jgi:hypothetical protein